MCVDQLFENVAPQRGGQLCTNPVLGGDWLVGVDPISEQKKQAHRALLAREWFAVYGPTDAPPLPLSGIAQEALRYRDPLGHLVAEFARSLEANKWDFQGHPTFDDFACGALASGYSPDFTRKNAQLREKYPPRRLCGLGPGQIWRKSTNDKSVRSVS
jgi:hypothetical protein